MPAWSYSSLRWYQKWKGLNGCNSIVKLYNSFKGLLNIPIKTLEKK